jgi:hypothetical protein
VNPNPKENTMRFIARFRPSAALVVASIALLASLAGTSVAAVTLIGPNTVASAQVVDGSLRSRDMSADQRSDAFSRGVVGPVQVTNRPSIVATLEIPRAGSYVVWGKLFATGDVSCDLVAGTDSDRSYGAASGDTPTARTPISVLVVHKFAAAGKVDLLCGTQYGVPPFGGTVYVINLTAIRVASVTASRTGSPT